MNQTSTLSLSGGLFFIFLCTVMAILLHVHASFYEGSLLVLLEMTWLSTFHPQGVT